MVDRADWLGAQAFNGAHKTHFLSCFVPWPLKVENPLRRGDSGKQRQGDLA